LVQNGGRGSTGERCGWLCVAERVRGCGTFDRGNGSGVGVKVGGFWVGKKGVYQVGSVRRVRPFLAGWGISVQSKGPRNKCGNAPETRRGHEESGEKNGNSRAKVKREPKKRDCAKKAETGGFG